MDPITGDFPRFSAIHSYIGFPSRDGSVLPYFLDAVEIPTQEGGSYSNQIFGSIVIPKAPIRLDRGLEVIRDTLYEQLSAQPELLYGRGLREQITAGLQQVGLQFACPLSPTSIELLLSASELTISCRGS